MNYPMPTLRTENLSPRAAEFAAQITKKNGTMYASRPKSKSGDAQYVWRMVAFSLSRNPTHMCMPVCAMFYLDDPEYRAMDFDGRRAYERELDGVADEIVRQFRVTEQPGTMRWGRAFGVC